jgi:outer membrane protein OmpA-like peptidoglycan-associated protein
MVWLVLALAAPTGAGAQDVAGSRDHELVPRFEGSRIVDYEAREFDALRVALGPVRGSELEASESLEGRLTRIRYRAPAGVSSLQLFRSYEQALADAGFEARFRCEGSACGSTVAFPRAAYPQLAGEISGGKDQRYLVARRRGPDADVTVAVYTFGHLGWGDAVAQVDVLEAAAMPDRMVKVEADAMDRALREEGRVALHAILFDFDEATLRPESAPQLEEIAALLARRPELRLFVVGHTDAEGALDYNLDLSRRRAAAVVEALASGHGVARERLSPHGVGPLAPLARNDDEAGRAKNRRVELVER